MTRSDKKQSKVFIVSRVTLYVNYNDILVIGAFYRVLNATIYFG